MRFKRNEESSEIIQKQSFQWTLGLMETMFVFLLKCIFILTQICTLKSERTILTVFFSVM